MYKGYVNEIELPAEPSVCMWWRILYLICRDLARQWGWILLPARQGTRTRGTMVRCCSPRGSLHQLFWIRSSKAVMHTPCRLGGAVSLSIGHIIDQALIGAQVILSIITHIHRTMRTHRWFPQACMPFSERGIHDHWGFQGPFPYHAPPPQDYYQPPPQPYQAPSIVYGDPSFYTRFDNHLTTLEEGQRELCTTLHQQGEWQQQQQTSCCIEKKYNSNNKTSYLC